MNKNKATVAFATFLVLTFAVTLIALPNANAQMSKKTYAFIGAMPNPVGVGQEVLLHVGIADSVLWPTDGFTGLTVTVTRPDGITETLGPYKTDTTGGTGVVYIPTMPGNYTLQAHFPTQTNPNPTLYLPANTTFLASSSEPLTLVALEEPISYYPGHALPNEYWTRPINSQLREWAVVGGNWLAPFSLMGTSIGEQWYAPGNAEAPESPHILWTRPIGDTMGGLIGGDYDAHSYGIGDAYEGKWSGSVIISGVLYYNKFESGQPQQEVVAVDLHTGRELWTKTFLDNRRIAFGQILYWDGFNYHGAFSYLWVTVGTTWHAFEALTGEWRYTMTNVPSGTNLYGPNGEIYRYTIDLAGGWMTLWNSSKVVMRDLSGSSLGSWGSAVRGVTYDATRGIEWNKTITTTDLPGAVRATFYADRAVGSYTDLSQVVLWAINLKPGSEGQLMFNKTWKAPSEWAEGQVSFAGMSGGWVAWSIKDKVGVLSIKETRQHYGFSIETGDYLWGPTPSQIYQDMYFGDGKFIYDGKFYSVGVGGIVYCYNATTGAFLWRYVADDTYTEYQLGNYWWLEPMFIADGKFYLAHAEHSPVDPRPRGAPFICLDANTGDLIWRVDGLLRSTHWGVLAIIGDSIIVTQNTYDQRIYALGKGPSAITVSAPDTAVELGKSVLVKGTVTDISPGTDDVVLQKRFPNGVPAVADECMGEWMKYVYMQFERPADVRGVEITLTVVDPNNNCYEVATTSSDADGFFSATFEPPVPGKYTVIARFAGSESYYGSSAETAIYVEEAPPATPETTATPQAPVETYFAISTVAIIVAVVLVGLLILRKR
ncbi:MAG: hypothetical protein QXJ76_04080 [Candidatus Bathyarchaeia archaeon]